LLLNCFRVTSAHSNHGSLFFGQEYFTYTGSWSGLWNWPIPESGTPEENENRKRSFILDRVVDWVAKYKNIDRCFCFFEAYAHFSPLYQQVGKRLLLMKSIGSMDVECMAKPFKHSILTKDRNALSNEKGIVLFRAGQNLKHLHHAHEVIKGKVYGGVNSHCDLSG
jgi:hypothetical protein